MPATDQITITPRDLKAIVYKLKEIQWNYGSVVIRDLGRQIYVRDSNDQYIFHIEKIHEEPG